MTVDQFVVPSVALGFGAYAVLGIFFSFGWRRRITGRAALLASLVTAGWFASLLSVGIRPVTHVLEIAAYAAWIALLVRILGLGAANWREPEYRVQAWLAGVALAIAAGSITILLLSPSDPVSEPTASRLPTLAKLGLCVLGLILVEQVVLNTRRNHQWNLKFIGIGLGTVFGYGFVLHSDALLFNAIRLSLLAPQGIACALAAPFLAIASLRNRTAPLNVNVSREFVFRSGMLIASGAYLLMMGAAGYYLRLFGGEWGDVLLVLLVTAALVFAAVLLFSTQVRSYVRSVVLRNLYERKYDYRDEWMRVTDELSREDRDTSLGQAAIHALAGAAQSSSGALWRLTDEQTLVPLAELNAGWREPFSRAATASIVRFFGARDWIVDLDQYREDASRYPGLTLTSDIERLGSARLLVPLFVEQRLFAIALLGQPPVDLEFGWEDFNILKVIGRQVAGFLALQHADRVLSESKQLRAMNQMSAFVIHDLKTVTAQLSLMVRNAEKHRHNPEFVDDMLRTTDHAVGRMNRLLAHLRETRRDSSIERLDLVSVTREALAGCDRSEPQPTFEAPSSEIVVIGERDRLVSAIGHIVKNAQEAAAGGGTVRVDLRCTDDWVMLDVSDTGDGMSEDFIQHQLFTPFTTTKGLSGMGIGTYQAREYFRSLGGDVTVTSRRGHGTVFTLRLPASAATVEVAAP